MNLNQNEYKRRFDKLILILGLTFHSQLLLPR